MDIGNSPSSEAGLGSTSTSKILADFLPMAFLNSRPLRWTYSRGFFEEARMCPPSAEGMSTPSSRHLMLTMTPGLLSHSVSAPARGGRMDVRCSFLGGSGLLVKLLFPLLVDHTHLHIAPDIHVPRNLQLH